MQVYLENIWLLFICQGHLIAVKVAKVKMLMRLKLSARLLVICLRFEGSLVLIS